MRIVAWINRNKLITLLLLLVVFLLWKQYYHSFPIVRPSSLRTYSQQVDYGDAAMVQKNNMAVGAPSRTGILPPSSEDFAPTSDADDRLVITTTSMSMVVENVQSTSKKIINHTESIGGYMVNTSLINPEDAPFASVVVRIPSDNLESALEYFRNLSIKITSENILGRDVTDEYVDIQAQLETLNKTKAKFEEILNKAVKVEDILRVQRELVNLQSQIDRLKGQQKYLEQNASLSKITVYLSTDELSLPFTPTEKFRPNVIFKTAVRSLFRNLQKFGGMLIWIGVYSVIVVPFGFIAWFVYLQIKKRNRTR